MRAVAPAEMPLLQYMTAAGYSRAPADIFGVVADRALDAGCTARTPRGPRVTTCYFVVSLQRTGHHAFIDWFARAREEPVAFFNNALPTDPPTLRARPHYHGNHPHLPGRTPLSNFAASRHDTILNFEGRMIDRVEGPCRTSVMERFGRSVTSIYFLRDPLNCIASLTKYAKRWDNKFYLRLFSQVAGFESIVKWIHENDMADQLVTFSGWRFDEDQRGRIAERLGVANMPPPEKTSKFGNGSSFQRGAFGRNADRDALLSRWRLMLDDPRFLAVFCDPVTRGYFERYFALAGSRELQDAAALEEVFAAARASREAQAIFEEKLAPFRRNLPLIHKLQGASTRPEREFLRFRIQAATGLLLHKS